MTASLSVPRSVLKELEDHARQIEEIIATLEELDARDGLRRIRTGLREYHRGQFSVLKDPREMRPLLAD